MSVLNNSSVLLLAADAGAAGGYQISRSLRFNSSDSAYLSRTPASAGNRKTWTLSLWVKRSAIGTNNELFTAGTNVVSGPAAQIALRTGSDIRWFSYSGAFQLELITTQVFRDPSAWYHLLFSVDTTQATAANRARIFVNGAQVTTFSTETYPSQNTDLLWNQAALQGIATNITAAGTSYLDGYLADIHFIDGQALDPTSFGEFDTNGVWQPIAYAGTYGTNGFHLPFSDNSTAAALGTDTSGNGNTWTVNNLSVTAGAGNDSLVDSPTNYGEDTGAGGEVRGNYCTWNALAKGSDCTLSNGNLDVAWGSAGSTTQGSATIGMSSGKWYWETTITASSASPTNAVLGITTKPFGDSEYPGYSATSWGYRGSDGQKWTNTSGSSYGASYANGDVVGVAFDADNGTLTFYKNGSSQGTAFTSLTSGPYFPAIGDQSSSQTFSAASNFGQRPFAYTAPSGFKALCTTNLPEPTIADGSTVMDAVLYTGNGSTQTISGLNFSPDLVWIKKRSGIEWHCINDTVRGAELYLSSNTTNAESGASNVLTAFTSTGYTVGSQGLVNDNGFTFASWCWDAGSSTVTNTEGSITSQVRANASAGFSVVTFNSGNSDGEFSVGHGLGVAPRLVIMKSRTRSGGPWWVHHLSATDTTTKYLQLSTTSAVIDNGGSGSIWGAALPTSTVFGFSVGAGRAHTQNEDIVSYCFAPVDGYSSFGSYTGNGSADGPFVYTGFRPRWILIKVSAGDTGNWWMYDSARSSYNLADLGLYANLDIAEFTSNGLDMLSNGFKIRTDNGNTNGSGFTFVWAAFAENPFAYARAR
jgi:hypothetical protein